MTQAVNVRTYQRLQAAIWQALHRGEKVACVDDAPAWDEDSAAAITACGTCPVLTICRPYALTGAVTHGIVAGLSMEDLADQRRAQARRERRRRREVLAVAA